MPRYVPQSLDNSLRKVPDFATTGLPELKRPRGRPIIAACGRSQPLIAIRCATGSRTLIHIIDIASRAHDAKPRIDDSKPSLMGTSLNLRGANTVINDAELQLRGTKRGGPASNIFSDAPLHWL
jgi:hypothetical protein